MSDISISPLLLIGTGTSFLLSRLFYHLYKEKKEEIRKLKEIPNFRPDQHLLKIVKTSAHKRLHYVAVEGVVQAEGEPLASQFVPRCNGVIQQVVVEEQWRFWNSVSKTWNSRWTNRKETNNSVPFGLVSPGAYYSSSDVFVKVQRPQEEASGSFLEEVYSRVQRVEEGLVDLVLLGLSGEKAVARRESESLLRVGTTVTAFGEVVLEGGKVMRVQAPQDGRSFVLVPTDYRSFMERHQSSATMWMVSTALCGATGVALLSGVVSGLLGKPGNKRE